MSSSKAVNVIDSHGEKLHHPNREMERLKCRYCLSTLYSYQLAECKGKQRGNEHERMSLGREVVGYTNAITYKVSNIQTVLWNLRFIKRFFRE